MGCRVFNTGVRVPGLRAGSVYDLGVLRELGSWMRNSLWRLTGHDKKSLGSRASSTKNRLLLGGI